MKLADELGYLPEVAEMMTKINMIRVSALVPGLRQDGRVCLAQGVHRGMMP
jgi:hypothetical protein